MKATTNPVLSVGRIPGARARREWATFARKISGVLPPGLPGPAALSSHIMVVLRSPQEEEGEEKGIKGDRGQGQGEEEIKGALEGDRDVPIDCHDPLSAALLSFLAGHLHNSSWSPRSWPQGFSFFKFH